MKSIFKYLLMIFISAALITGCSSNKESENEEHSEHKESETVKLSSASIKEIGLQTETIKLSPFKGVLKMPAQVHVNQDNEAHVGCLVPGRVFKIYAKPGDYVKAGQVLMTVEGLEIGEIKAAFLSAKAELDYNKANYERLKTLTDQKIASKKSLFEAQAEYEKALAEYNAQDKKIHSVGLNDDEVINTGTSEHTSGTLPVKAPISGVIVERNVVTGQYIDGTSNAFRIFNTGTVWIDGQVYEKDLNKINGKPAALFTTASYPGEKFKGNISFTGFTIDEQSRTVTVRGEFSNPGNKLKPQMFGEMEISAGENSMAILIPAEALIKIDNQDYVFVQNRDSSFVKRKVVTGSQQNDMIEIKEGLSEKDNLVVKGAFYLKSEFMKDELAEDEH